jgi:hypothetical protein
MRFLFFSRKLNSEAKYEVSKQITKQCRLYSNSTNKNKNNNGNNSIIC